MATKYYLDQEGVQLLWARVCEQDRDLLDKTIANSNRIDEIIDQIGTTKILYDTSANWAAQPDLIAEKGVVYIYSDAKTYEGQVLPRIKIGNGFSLLRTIYFVDEDIVHQLSNLVPVTQEEKDRWNNKVSCQVDREKLIFSTD